MASYWAQQLRSEVSNWGRLLVSPAQAIYFGHVFIISYMLGGVALSLLGVHELFKLCDKYLFYLRLQYHITPRIFSLTKEISEFIIYAIFAPVILCLFALPVHSIWVNGKFKILSTLKNTPRSIAWSLHSMTLMLRPVLYMLITPIVMLVGYYGFFGDLNDPLLKNLYLVILVIVAFFSLLKAMPFLFMPLIVLCAQAHPFQSQSIALEVIPTKRIKLGLLWLLTATLIWAILHFSGGAHLNGSFKDLAPLILALLIFWYATMISCVLILETITLIQQKQSVVNPQDAQQNPYPNAQELAQMAEVFRAMQAGTVNVYIENYLNKKNK